MPPTIAQIEAGAVTRLDAALSYLVQCDSYAGQIEDAAAGVPVEAPACFVMFDGFSRDEERSSRTAHVGTGNFSIVVFADSFKGHGRNRRDTHGAYAVVEDVITALDDHALGLTGFDGLCLSGIEMVRVTATRAIYQVRFSALMIFGR